MTRKEIINSLLSGLEEDRKEAFVAEIRAAKTKEERQAVMKKYNITRPRKKQRHFGKLPGVRFPMRSWIRLPADAAATPTAIARFRAAAVTEARPDTVC